MVSTLDFESSDPSSNLGGTCGFLMPFLVLLAQYICVWIPVLRRLPLDHSGRAASFAPLFPTLA